MIPPMHTFAIAALRASNKKEVCIALLFATMPELHVTFPFMDALGTARFIDAFVPLAIAPMIDDFFVVSIRRQ